MPILNWIAFTVSWTVWATSEQGSRGKVVGRGGAEDVEIASRLDENSVVPILMNGAFREPGGPNCMNRRGATLMGQESPRTEADIYPVDRSRFGR